MQSFEEPQFDHPWYIMIYDVFKTPTSK